MTEKTPEQIADEAMEAFTITYEEDVEERSAEYIHEQIVAAIEADRAQRRPHLETLIDAAEKWRTELHEYIIPNAAETSDEDALRYALQAQRIEAAIAALGSKKEG